MKNIKKILSGTLLMVLSGFLVCSFQSCARKINFGISEVVPAARGSVKVRKDRNDNYAIKIQISNLAEVERLQTGRKAYVVWLASGSNVVKNIGQINSSTTFMSKKLNATFSTVSSSAPDKIFITAEDDAAVLVPSSQIILSTQNF